MIGQTVRLKDGDGALYRVRRDGINQFGRRQLRLRALDGGSLLFVEPEDVEVIEDDQAEAEPEAITGLASEVEDEAERQAEGDGGD